VGSSSERLGQQVVVDNEVPRVFFSGHPRRLPCTRRADNQHNFSRRFAPTFASFLIRPAVIATSARRPQIRRIPPRPALTRRNDVIDVVRVNGAVFTSDLAEMLVTLEDAAPHHRPFAPQPRRHSIS